QGIALRRVGEDLHQPDRSRLRARVRLELRLLVDDGRDQCRIELVVPRMTSHDLLVVERVPEPLPPARLRGLQHAERKGKYSRNGARSDERLNQVKRQLPSPTKASSYLCVPS